MVLGSISTHMYIYFKKKDKSLLRRCTHLSQTFDVGKLVRFCSGISVVKSEDFDIIWRVWSDIAARKIFLPVDASQALSVALI